MAAPRESLHVIGLISGGKDSFFSLMHCIANNHHVVALANLYTRAYSDGSEDLNSFMYQTAGQGVVSLYSEAVGLPLYRQEIQGSAVNQSKDYYAALSNRESKDPEHVNEDETESLLPLLRQVMNAHPWANAICSGAILSTYQRTRIESVAQRLGLISLSYLWQYPSLPPPSPGGLLDDMTAAGFDVRIVKVASGGLDEGLLWGNLMDDVVRRKVHKGVGRFGGSVLGEGGEYESLVIDGPLPLWRGRIEAKPSERWIEKGLGGEAWIGFREPSGKVILKEDEEVANGGREERIRIPELWDVEFDKLVRKMSNVSSHDVIKPRVYNLVDGQQAWKATMTVAKSSSALTLYNITAPQAGNTASEQMSAVNSQLLEVLKEHNLSDTGDIIFTTILLRTMTDFTPVNDIYGQLFAQPNPPARVTVACGDGMPLGVLVMVSSVICLDKECREGLHVQSRSYWAPANIGPYSQAISVPLELHSLDPRLVYISGQISLVPATMETLQAKSNTADGASEKITDFFPIQACLGLQHLWRVGQAMHVNWWTAAIAFIVGINDGHAKALVAWKAWEELHQAQFWRAGNQGGDEGEDECDRFDVWDRKYGGLGSFASNEGKDYRLPDFERSAEQTSCNVPPFFAVQIDGLPRGCEIEWQSSGIAYSICSTPTVQSPTSCISLSSDTISSDHQFRTRLKEIFDTSKEHSSVGATIYTPRPDLVGGLGLQVVPCRAVWGPAGVTLAAGIVLRNELCTAT